MPTSKIRTQVLDRAVAVAGGGAAMTVLLWVVTRLTDAPGEVRTPLAMLATAAASVAGVAWLLRRHAQAVDQRLTAARCAIRDAVRDEVSAAVGDQLRVLEAATAGSLEHVAGELRAIREALPARLGERLAEVEDSVESVGVVAEALGRMRANGSGQVHQLRRYGGGTPPDRQRPR